MRKIEELSADIYADQECIGAVDITVISDGGDVVSVSIGNVTFDGDTAKALLQEMLFRTDQATHGH